MPIINKVTSLRLFIESLQNSTGGLEIFYSGIFLSRVTIMPQLMLNLNDLLF